MHALTLRPRSYAPRTSIRAGAVLLLLLLLTWTLATGCSGKDEGAIDPVQALADSTVAMEALESFHFTYEVTKPEDSPRSEGLEIVRIIGDVGTDGTMQATIDLLQRGVPLQVAFVATGSTHYIQDPTSQKWQSMPAAFSPIGSLDLSKGAIQILRRIGSPEYMGSEDLGGVSTYHIKGMVEAAEVAAIAGSTSTDEPFEGSVWVGAEDHLVYRIVVEGAATASEIEGTLRTIELSDFDKPLEIVAPE